MQHTEALINARQSRKQHQLLITKFYTIPLQSFGCVQPNGSLNCTNKALYRYHKGSVHTCNVGVFTNRQNAGGGNVAAFAMINQIANRFGFGWTTLVSICLHNGAM